MDILVVDDEALARERLVSLLSEFDNDYKVVGEAENGKQAVEKALGLMPDIILLDIKMPGMNGLEVAHHLAKNDNAPSIIFTTAYDEHALAAFDAQAIAYLLKPIQSEQLERSLQTAKALRQGQIQHLQTENKTQRRFISVKVRGDLQLISVEGICYFRADQKYIEMRHSDGVSLIDESLKSLEEEFSERFVRVHRNAIVAIDSVIGIERDSLGRSYVLLRNCDERLDISRRHIAELRRLLKSRS